MEKLLHNVGDLPATARSAVEGLIGRALRDDQQVYIVAIDPSSVPTAPLRRKAWQDLQEILGSMRINALQSGLTGDQVEQVIDEVCDQVRYGD